jgi:hypothetical protein
MGGIIPARGDRDQGGPRRIGYTARMRPAAVLAVLLLLPACEIVDKSAPPRKRAESYDLVHLERIVERTLVVDEGFTGDARVAAKDGRIVVSVLSNVETATGTDFARIPKKQRLMREYITEDLRKELGDPDVPIEVIFPDRATPSR